MNLQDAENKHIHAVTAYGAGFVTLNGERHTASLALSPTGVFPWAVTSLDTLSAADFRPLLASNPELIILGTGKSLRWPHPSVLAECMAQGVGVEVMDTEAACRTYNFLLVEGRKMAVGLIIEPV